jgi:hypothetical protein
MRLLGVSQDRFVEFARLTVCYVAIPAEWLSSPTCMRLSRRRGKGIEIYLRFGQMLKWGKCVNGSRLGRSTDVLTC